MKILLPLTLLSAGLLLGCDSDGRSVAAESVWSAAPAPAGAEKKNGDVDDSERDLAPELKAARAQLGELMLRLDRLTARARLPAHDHAVDVRLALDEIRERTRALEERLFEIDGMDDELAASALLGEDFTEEVEKLEKELDDAEEKL